MKLENDLKKNFENNCNFQWNAAKNLDISFFRKNHFILSRGYSVTKFQALKSSSPIKIDQPSGKNTKIQKFWKQFNLYKKT